MKRFTILMLMAAAIFCFTNQVQAQGPSGDPVDDTFVIHDTDKEVIDGADGSRLILGVTYTIEGGPGQAYHRFLAHSDILNARTLSFLEKPSLGIGRYNLGQTITEEIPSTGGLHRHKTMWTIEFDPDDPVWPELPPPGSNPNL